jgi:hypothetical protein
MSAKVPETRAHMTDYGFHVAGSVAHSESPLCTELISRAETVAWLREIADDPIEGGVPYTGLLRRLADALEGGR